MDMTRCLFCGMCVEACPVDALGMTREYEWSVSDKRDLLLNKQQLLAVGDRSFPIREKCRSSLGNRPTYAMAR
jgi:NADH-quinone oxidoreductase subunit I